MEGQRTKIRPSVSQQFFGSYFYFVNWKQRSVPCQDIESNNNPRQIGVHVYV